MKEFSLMGYGILALVFEERYINGLIEADADKFGQTPAQAKDNVIKRLHILRRAVFGSLLALTISVLIGLLLAMRLPPSPKVWVGVASIFCFAWATLAKLGWQVGSFAGNTVVERLDLLIFRLLYCLGTFLGTLALL